MWRRRVPEAELSRAEPISPPASPGEHTPARDEPEDQLAVGVDAIGSRNSVHQQDARVRRRSPDPYVFPRVHDGSLAQASKGLRFGEARRGADRLDLTIRCSERRSDCRAQAWRTVVGGGARSLPELAFSNGAIEPGGASVCAPNRSPPTRNAWYTGAVGITIDRRHPVTHDYGLIGAPLGDVVREFLGWQASLDVPHTLKGDSRPTSLLRSRI